jgi:hypothetical protein
MPYATLTFTAPLNTSCQIGDIAYYATTEAQGGFDTAYSGIVKIGDIREISGTVSNPVMLVETTMVYTELNGLSNKFILFTKDDKVNLNSPLGYYASVKMVNDSTTEAELFSVGMEVFDSSK